MYSFPCLEPVCCSVSSSNCCFLTCIWISQEAGQVVWYSHLFQNFPQFIVIHKVKGFGIVNKAEIYVFLELSCFFSDPVDIGSLISGSSAFSKTSLNIWKFTVHILLKPGLENFEPQKHYTKWNKSDTKEQISYAPLLWVTQNRHIRRHRRLNSGDQRLWAEDDEKWMFNDAEFQLGWWELLEMDRGDPLFNVVNILTALEWYTWKMARMGLLLVVQWLRVCLSIQGTQTGSLLQELRSHMPWGN